MSSRGDHDGERIEELLGRYVEQRVVSGVVLNPEDLCQDNPELLDSLREHIRAYEQVNRLLAPPGDLAGRTLLHYRIVERLGAGSMGEVYVAEDAKLGRRVALKVLLPEMADQERLERFRREARIVAALNHSNIVTIFSVEEAEGISFLTMELVEGKTLAELIPPGGMEPGRIVEIAGQLVDALVAAHERGVIHRDLKPANIMVASDGRLKILDFGLAKLRAPPAGSEDANLARTLTAGTLSMEGRVLGTLPYMSPEQVQGETIDPRTDIFSLGVVFFEMAAGQRPFEGENMAELISSILRDTPAPMNELRDDLPPQWERLVHHCLEKDPEHRCQSALEVRHHLDDLKKEVHAGEGRPDGLPAPEGSSVTQRRPVRRGFLQRAVAGVAPGLVAGFLILWGWWAYRESGRTATELGASRPAAAARQQAGSPDRASLAVLYFHNLTEDPELDWLSSGITDMLVTDLSQSPEIEVLSTSRLYQVLEDLNALERPRLSLELVRKVAEQTAVEVVVRGSFVRLGEVFRIAFTIEEATSGTTLTSKHVDGRGEESLFAMVDELSAAIRNSFEVAPHPETPVTVAEVTTSSLEAWRLYSEGLTLHRQSKRREAIVIMEKAVEIDPTFALALANLGRLHENLGHVAQARDYTRRAVEQAERLPLDRRHEIEAVFYATRWTTLDRAIEAYQEALRLYPDHSYLRNNLAKAYADLEQYEEATREYRTLIDGGTTFPGSYVAIATAYAGLGRFEMGYRTLLDFAKRQPENWYVQLGLGWHLTEWGKPEEALKRFQRAADLRPGELFVHNGRWRVQVLREDWEQAEREAAQVFELSDPLAAWRGAVSQARNSTFRGRSEDALLHFDKAIREYREPDAFSALARCWKAELLLQRGEAARALAEAKLAQELGREEWPELKALFLTALAHQQLDHPSEVRRIENTLRQRATTHPNVVEERQLHHLAGLLALARANDEAAVAALSRAAKLLPPEGVEFHWHVYPVHVPIWHALGKAELAAGRPEEALRWFRKAVTSGAEHLESPVPYVRSFYFLGHILQQRGEGAESRRYFERFLELWQGGDLDRERVEEALSAVETGRRTSR